MLRSLVGSEMCIRDRTVILNDAHGHLCTVADESVLAMSSSDGYDLSAKQTGLGECQIEFLPTLANFEHQIEIKVGGLHVCGSPFRLPVLTALPSQLVVAAREPCVTAAVCWWFHSQIGWQTSNQPHDITDSALQPLDEGVFCTSDAGGAQISGGCLVQLFNDETKLSDHWFYSDPGVVPETRTIDPAAPNLSPDSEFSPDGLPIDDLSSEDVDPTEFSDYDDL
eukprot:TRINITY_DN54407_c0_g1_i3.p1 TRINITY_DN54407_c0_g1~~TRINITY_DN54407_c0_g1_i3.p1  ORF type:complete len:224 (-),score=46.92 TRINITY_DN54407_c0_g1_i3:92-763(-)